MFTSCFSVNLRPSDTIYDYVKGRLTKASNGDCELQWRHDALGRVEEESLECDDFRHSVAHRYDPLGNGTHSRYPFAGEIDYLSYGSGHVHQILLNKEAQVDFERDTLHRETLRTLLARAEGTAGKAVTQFKAFDPMGRLLRSQLQGGAPLQSTPGTQGLNPQTPIPTVGGLSREYGYSAIGLMVSIKKPALRETEFGYDAFHRLRYERERQHVEQAPYNVILNPHPRPSHAVASHSWEFDPAGNRVSASGHSAPDNRIVFDGERRFEYDAWGNTRKIAYVAGKHKGMHILMVYDGLHQLRASQTYSPQADEKHRTLTVHYRYDALGRRIEKKRVRESANSAGQPATQTLQQTCYGWDGDRLVTTQTPEQVTSTIYEPHSFVPLLRIDMKTSAGGEEHKTLYHYHCNHLGTPVALSERETGALVWQIELDPWGITRSLFNPHDIHQPIKMQGQQLDVETGLFYNRYRYYDPRVGRYVTQDPIGLWGGANLYGYAEAKPISLTGPLGLATYMCTQPLHALGKAGRAIYSPSNNPLYHQFVGIIRPDGTVMTGGQDRAGGPWSQGRPSEGDGAPGSNADCKKIQNDNECLEQCLISKFAAPRPKYSLALQGLTGGLNCQGWSDSVVSQCQSSCNTK